MSQWFLSYTVFIVAASFLRIPFTIIWACVEAGRRNKPSNGFKALPIFLVLRPTEWQWKWRQKLLISPKSKLNSNNISLICSAENILCSIEFDQARCKRIFEGSLTLLASFDFATSCPKNKSPPTKKPGSAPTLSSWVTYSLSVYSNICHPFQGQLKAVKLEHSADHHHLTLLRAQFSTHWRH